MTIVSTCSSPTLLVSIDVRHFCSSLLYILFGLVRLFANTVGGAGRRGNFSDNGHSLLALSSYK